MPGSAPPAASSSSGFWNFLGGLVNQWSAIGGRVIAPTTTIQSGPGGTTISTPAGSPVPAANLSALGVGLGSGNSIMWILLALGAVVLLSRKS
jgi:hypothetical protein